MTLDDLKVKLYNYKFELLGILHIWDATTAKLMTIDTYRQRQRFNPLNVLFNTVFLALICNRFLR